MTGALSPGPLTAFAISQGPRQGSFSGMQLALGHLLVEGPLALAIAYGLGIWLRTPAIGGSIGIVGGLFMLWMGYGLLMGAWRNQMRLESAADAGVTGSAKALTSAKVASLNPVATGALLSVSNPYWSLWWATVGATQLTQASQYGLPGILLLYLVGHWSVDLSWLGGLSFATASGRNLISPTAYRAIILVCGVFLMAMSVLFAISGLQAVISGQPLGI